MCALVLIYRIGMTSYIATMVYLYVPCGMRQLGRCYVRLALKCLPWSVRSHWQPESALARAALLSCASLRAVDRNYLRKHAKLKIVRSPVGLFHARHDLDVNDAIKPMIRFGIGTCALLSCRSWRAPRSKFGASEVASTLEGSRG